LLVTGAFHSLYTSRKKRVHPRSKKVNKMGRGDKKTKKGKIFKGSYGKSRPAKPAKKSAAKKDSK